MTHSGSITEQIEGIRRQTVAVLDDLLGKAGEFELADPPAALGRYREKLRENAYKVLVVGEAKRGKSTFVNALIGRDILPTDVDVATSQVFNIRPSEREAYRVRYEDGSAREILPEDLPRYGSRTTPDTGAVPMDDQLVRWIEVDMPIRFLPEGVSILDTPGLGALHAGHAQITHRFVPEADAVIFVLESGQPVVEDDLKFIEQILTVTRNIFFVQTKIDQHSKEDWQDIQNRNGEILQQRFEGRLADTRVWPVSSTNLRKAASSADEKTEQVYLMVSRYRELMGALRVFLARVSGWGRTAAAVALAAEYQATSRKALAGRLATLTAESEQKQAEQKEIAVESKRRFDSEWGIQGRKYKELKEGLQRSTAIGKQSFSNTLQQGSDIELTQKAKIEEIKTLKQANRVAEEMPGEIVTAVMNDWARICDEVQQRCVELLGPFAEAIENLDASVDPDLIGLSGEDAKDKFKHDYFTMFRSAAGGGMMVMGVTGIGSMMLPAAAAAVFTTVMPFVAIPALAVLVGGGIKGARTTGVKTSQQQLKMQLAEQLQKVRRYFFDVHLTTGSYSRVDEYFMTLDRTVNEHVRGLVEKKSRDSQAEISRLKEAMQLGEREREAQTTEIQAQLAGWDEVGKSLGALGTRIKMLQRPAAPAKTQAAASERG